MSTDALARRRLLLKGATGGTAALAALTPVGALATGTTVGSTVLVCTGTGNKPALCTMSGVGSATHSFGSNVTQIPACGRTPTYWQACETWPATSPTACSKATGVSSVLSGCSSTFNGKSLLWALQNKGTSDEAIWICAYLNGATMYTAGNPTTTLTFPYSSAQVKAFWDAGGTTRSNALTLFRAITTKSS